MMMIVTMMDMMMMIVCDDNDNRHDDDEYKKISFIIIKITIHHLTIPSSHIIIPSNSDQFELLRCQTMVQTHIDWVQLLCV